jgi:hypothetical protein
MRLVDFNPWARPAQTRTEDERRVRIVRGPACPSLRSPKHWPTATLKTAMRAHLDQTLAEATHQLKGNYAASVKEFDATEKHILMMADMLSAGIIAQFPEKFTGK